MAARARRAGGGPGVVHGVAARVSTPVLAVPGRATAVGLELPPGLEAEAWLDVGRAIMAAGGAMMWWVGDWALYRANGEAYSDRFKEHVQEIGMSYHAVKNAKTVAKAYSDFSRRREKLGWAHHAVAAGLDDEAMQDEMLERAETEGWTERTFREVVRRLKKGGPEGPRDPRGTTYVAKSRDPHVAIVMLTLDAETLLKARPAEIAARVAPPVRPRMADGLERFVPWLEDLIGELRGG